MSLRGASEPASFGLGGDEAPALPRQVELLRSMGRGGAIWFSIGKRIIQSNGCGCLRCRHWEIASLPSPAVHERRRSLAMTKNESFRAL
jgi:hypothetical protein